MLFWQEIKKLAGSVVYVLFVAVLIMELSSQGVFSFHDKLEEPQPGENYGIHNEEIPELVMPAAIKELFQEYTWNQYTTYPIGLYKNVKLKEKEKAQMAEILSELTGIKAERFSVEEEAELQKGISEHEIAPRADLTYEEFKACMEQADRLLGGGSDYAPDALIGFGKVPVTYEDARVEYQLVKDKDQFTGGYARLFSDYAGVMAMAILPVFLSVALCLKDRRNKMSQLVYSRKVSSAVLVGVRYAAILTVVMVPVVILAYYSNSKVWNLYEGMQLDYLAPLKYAFGWLLPSAMVSAAVGMFFTELTGTPIAIAVQCFWWFLDLNAGYKNISSSYGLFRLAPRHNAGTLSRFRVLDFTSNFDRLVQNRLLMAGLALVLVVLTIFAYDWKRRGKIGERFKIRSVFAAAPDRKNKSAA